MDLSAGADERLLAEKLIGFDSSNEDGIRACAGYVKGWLEARDIRTSQYEIRGLPITQLEGLAEYDYHLDHYIPFHVAQELAPDAVARIRAGQLPDFVDAEEFRTRVLAATQHIVDTCDHGDTVAVFAHGGVINVLLQDLLGLDRPLMFPIEYTSVTRILVSRNGARRAASVNETGHVRDMLRV